MEVLYTNGYVPITLLKQMNSHSTLQKLLT